MAHWTKLPEGTFVPHDCPYGVGAPYCIYHDHDDELCLKCLVDFRKSISQFIKKIRKESKNETQENG